MLLFYLLLSYMGMLPENNAGSTLIVDAVGIFSIVVFFIASVAGILRSTNLRIRNGITAFAVSSFLFLAAACIRATYPYGLNVPGLDLSASNALDVTGSIVFIAALCLVRKSITVKKIDVRTIGLLVIGSVVLGGLILLVSATLSHSTAVNFSALAIVRMVIDFTTLALIMDLMLATLGRNMAESQVIMAVGVVIISVTDIVYSMQASIGLSPLKNFLFAIGYLLFAISIWLCIALTRQDILNDRLAKLQRRSVVK